LNVKSKYDIEDENNHPRSQYMRGGCGAPYCMISGPTRMDVSNLRPPDFLRRIFQAMGWKTGSEQNPDNK
jgi:hypothetical protein